MKIKLTKGLSLNKVAITKLQESQVAHFKGGIVPPVKSCELNTCMGDMSCEVVSCR
ncbi:class I lanthipeptide [Flavobacterium sp. ZS1P70]|uniref:Class I lanthipeptide n=1 Tax=Flavobacterium zhoui TaxID=3230414 RepID=A0ABW6I7B1_9FLAO